MTKDHGRIYFADDEIEARKLCVRRADGADRVVFSRAEVQRAIDRSKDLDFDLLGWMKTLILVKQTFPTARVDSVQINQTIESQTSHGSSADRKGADDGQGKFFDNAV